MLPQFPSSPLATLKTSSSSRVTKVQHKTGPLKVLNPFIPQCRALPQGRFHSPLAETHKQPLVPPTPAPLPQGTLPSPLAFLCPERLSLSYSLQVSTLLRRENALFIAHPPFPAGTAAQDTIPWVPLGATPPRIPLFWGWNWDWPVLMFSLP